MQAFSSTDTAYFIISSGATCEHGLPSLFNDLPTPSESKLHWYISALMLGPVSKQPHSGIAVSKTKWHATALLTACQEGLKHEFWSARGVSLWEMGRSQLETSLCRSGTMQSAFFFLYNGTVCLAFFLMLGTVGWRSSLSFVRHIYRCKQPAHLCR